MVEYAKLRMWVGKRIRLRFDTDAEIDGVLLEIRPVVGTPQMIIMKDVDILQSGGKVLGHHDQLSVVPNCLTAIEEHPVPAISFRRPNNQ